ncbi:hypothetical protein GCM10022600_06130 [Qipengyuania pelagi]|jgi:hypothetical protein|uniref:Uncharacterized protein n=1 Tax=Qipengyuania pelagi TaxID=994320 RepID=A0A844YCM2_9SPHN|nr:hypothetical protein [Qipengyuania pelagi]MXO54983.1 hypothetical protein [Qipengyuania pelagi]|tara:strand:- start:59 stop:463 length:405 start_codon:yes stop_codon:yes gene_type:complete
MPRLSSLATAAAAITLVASPASAERKSGEEKLAEMIDGRVAGEPQSCINTFNSRPLTVIDDTAIVYRSGDTVYVNRTRAPQTLDNDDVLVIRKFGSGSRLCRLDQVSTRDRFNGFYTGNIFLTDFVPYRRVGTD